MDFFPRSLRGARALRRCGFSLIELMVVIGIIAILIALLMPSLIAARRNAKAIQCASNLRQLTIGMINYSVEFDGYFPPNVGLEKMFWYNNAAVGRYIGFKSRDGTAVSEGVEQQIGGVFVCPADLEGAVRSYSMNTFASSIVSPFVTLNIESEKPNGKLFKSNTKESSHLILLIEAFSLEDWPAEDPNPTGWAAPALVGFSPRPPAKRFGTAGAVFLKDTPRYGSIAAQIAYFRHRPAKQGGGLGDGVGRLNIGFADGHVALQAHNELLDKQTGKSTYQAMWSTIDREID